MNLRISCPFLTLAGPSCSDMRNAARTSSGRSGPIGQSGRAVKAAYADQNSERPKQALHTCPLSFASKGPPTYIKPIRSRTSIPSTALQPFTCTPLHDSTNIIMTVNFFTTTFGILTRSVKLAVGLVPLLGFVLQLHARDTYYALLNLVLFWRPKRPGNVIAQGKPGFGGIWPQYRAPSPSDSRSPCPGLNALANHGILPRDGKKLTYKQMSHAIQYAYNLSPALGDQLTSSAYLLDQGRGWINLHDLNTLNIIQHDASFTRPDIAFCPDQSYPHAELVDRLLKCSSDGTVLTLEDWAYFSGLRRAECKASNGQYSMTYSFIHKFFGSGNAALLYSIFGGRVNDLEVFLKEERIPEGWEPRNREPFGHTIIQAQKTSLEIEFNVNENQALRAGDELLDQAKPNYAAVGKLIAV